MAEFGSDEQRTFLILSSNHPDASDAATADAGRPARPPFLDEAAAFARGGLSGWQRRKVADYIEAHIGDDLPLPMLAKLVNLSPYHFARAFKRSFGLPPHRYHMARRIARAKAMLDEPTRTITDIARQLGFAETSSFSAAFRRATGISPSRYRRSRT
jgi:AraC family transcriptional regulator